METLSDFVARFICGLFIWTFCASIVALAYCQVVTILKWRAWRQRRTAK